MPPSFSSPDVVSCPFMWPMSDLSDQLQRAEQGLEEQRTTSAAREIHLDSYQENSLDQTPSVQESFENARDNVQQPQQTEQNQAQGQAEMSHAPEPMPAPRPTGPEAEAVDREVFDQRQNDLDQHFLELNQSLNQENGIEDQNELGLEDGRNDNHDLGR